MYALREILDTSDGVEYDLISLEDYKTATGAGDSEDDANSLRITRNSKLIGEFCGRVFAAIDVRETFVFNSLGESSLAQQPLTLWQYPIIQVYSVTVNDSEITDYEYSTAGEQDSRRGLLWRTGTGSWSGRVVVHYRGGYELPDDAPASLQALLIEAVRQASSFSSADPTIRSTTHGDTSVSYYSAPQQGSHGLPAVVTSGLGAFKRTSFA